MTPAVRACFNQFKNEALRLRLALGVDMPIPEDHDKAEVGLQKVLDLMQAASERLEGMT